MQQNPSPQPDDVGKLRTKNKRKRLFGIQYRRQNWWRFSATAQREWTEWAHWKSYRTAEERDRALEVLSRKHASIRWEFRAEDEVRAP